MEKQDKDLLLRDLCARIPYDTVVCVDGQEVYLRAVDTFGYEVEVAQAGVNVFTIEEIKPYLRPMSSMTEEEKTDLLKYLEHTYQEEDWEGHCSNSYSIKLFDAYSDTPYWDMIGIEAIDWLNSHHFDYRGLIPKGLALEAPADMY